MNERFDIYFSGELLPDHAPETVRAWLGKQFGLQGEALEHLFSGQPVRIKQAVDMDTAGRFRAAFRKAGALLEIRPVATAAEPVPDPPAATADTADEPELLPANTGSLEDCALPVEAAPMPDISGLDLASTGSDIDETPPPPAREIDTSHLSAAPANTGDLDETPPPPARDIDTSHLSAAPANTGDLSDCRNDKPARPIPDISGLSLTDD